MFAHSSYLTVEDKGMNRLFFKVLLLCRPSLSLSFITALKLVAAADGR